MRRKINLSKTIHKDARTWEYLLTSMGFNKKYNSIGSEYCNHHSIKEGIVKTTDLDPNAYSLLPISLSILDELHLTDLKELYITDDLGDVEISIYLDQIDNLNLIPSDLISSTEEVIKKAVVDKINDDIKKSDSKILEINILIKSVSLISEKDMKSLMLIKSSYMIK